MKQFIESAKRGRGHLITGLCLNNIFFCQKCEISSLPELSSPESQELKYLFLLSEILQSESPTSYRSHGGL